MENYPEDELTLRDLYLILKKRARLIVGLTLGLGVLAFFVSLIIPKTYDSAAVLAVVPGDGAKPAALVEAFRARIGTQAFAERLGEEGPVSWAKVRFDEKRGYLKLEATAPTPEGARHRAEALARAAIEDFTAAAEERLRRDLRREQIDLEAALVALQKKLKELKANLAGFGTERASSLTGEVLRSVGVDPLVARSLDPGRAYLRLEVAKTEAELAAKSARMAQIETTLKDPEALKALAQGSLGIRLVGAPGLPLKPSGPRVLLNTALALVLGFFLAVFGAFLAAALEEPEPASPENPPVPQP